MFDIFKLLFAWMPDDLQAFCVAALTILVLVAFVQIILMILRLFRG